MKRFGVMLDCSRNAVMNLKSVEKYADYLSSFGYNTLMLYTEDTYEVNNEPYFGARRGRFTKDELKEINAYCLRKNIELIPCIQTLAHLNAIFKWREYAYHNDTADILLAEDERVYALINNMFETIAECFTSEYVHIGMDEAFQLGLGQYLIKHGYKDRFEILTTHLNKVVEIGKKYGKKCIMWSDMFFRLASGGDYYDEKNLFKVTDKIKSSVDKDVELVYWDYYHKDKKIYDDMIRKHKLLSDNPVWFAGGAWSWIGFTPHNDFSLKTMLPAMRSCRENGIDDIIITLWGDNGGECSKFSLLPSLYRIKRAYDGVDDLETVKTEFFKLTGENYDDMMKLDLPDVASKKKDYFSNPSKYVLYSDLFNCFLEPGFAENGEKVLKKNAKILKNTASEKFAYLFDAAYKLCDAVAYKYTLAKRIRESYKRKNGEEIKAEIKQIAILIKKIKSFYSAFKKQWFTENKPHGFDVQDLRIGGLIFRLESCKDRLFDYINGKIDGIPELDEDLLPFYGAEDKTRGVGIYNNWNANVTVNVL